MTNSIFLNNNASNIIYSKYSVIVNYNWFGNNEKNYNQHPSVHSNNVIDSWLFLNATANPTTIAINENSKITFKLDSYNDTSKEINDYDASKMNIRLNLSQTLGELDKTTALIGKEILYTAKQSGNAIVLGNFKTISYTINLKNMDHKKEN